ncbi:MAG TPA: head GIN domain-containing protein [Ignavibacteria bacterium]|nr:head GIN domain-containing protein [Ignavibacteria bacterium]HMR39908.1 head GIN domain-containing protein [Ignavibacteria bacterium]
MNTLNLLLFLILSATVLFSASETKSQTSVKGNGNVAKETRSISSFSKIELNSVMNVFLNQSGTESITIEADNNLFSYIETYVENNTLKIETKKNYNLKNYKKLNVYINYKDINDLVNNSVGNVRSEHQLNFSSLNIENNSVGNLDLDLNGKNLNVEINSVGNVTFSGKADNVNIENNSVGNLEAFDLAAVNLNIENNSVGNSEVYATGEITIESNGVGNVIYKGDAVVKSLQKSGVGSVKKK